MSLEIIRINLADVKADIIVNSTNSHMVATGGADFYVHQKAGKGLDEACKNIVGLQVGEVALTDAYDLDAKYIIHTVGPVYDENDSDLELKLESCYKKSLELAKEKQCNSIAFPLISSGSFRFPKELAFKIATKTIRNFLLDNEMDVYLVVYDKESFEIAHSFYKDIKEYVNDHFKDFRDTKITSRKNDIQYSISYDIKSKSNVRYSKDLTLNEFELDESWQECLFRLISSKGINPVVCYKKANVNKQLFSKINSNSKYKPSKNTAIAFAIALELNVKETKDMLEKAGYALSRSDLADVIVEAFIKNKNYDIDEINMVLMSKDLKPLNNY